MSHTHFTLIGAQPLPVYRGIKFTNADRVILMHSIDTKNVAERVSEVIGQNCQLCQIQNPFDYNACKNEILKIVTDFSDEMQSFNVSGGTKIMTLVAAEISRSMQIMHFYLDQNNILTNFIQGTETIVSELIPIDIHFRLFGQTAKRTTRFQDVEKVYIDYALKIQNSFFKYSSLFKDFRNLKNSDEEKFQISNKHFEIAWNPSELDVQIVDLKFGSSQSFKGQMAFNFFFNTAWYEIFVAQIVARWKFSKQIYWNTIIPLTSNEYDKNEIDLIIDTGIKLVFIECKTFVSEVRDIDKFRNVVKNYGGLASKGILVTNRIPPENVIEKCRDNNISVFWFYDKNSSVMRSPKELIELFDKEYLIINPI